MFANEQDTFLASKLKGKPEMKAEKLCFNTQVRVFLKLSVIIKVIHHACYIVLIYVTFIKIWLLDSPFKHAKHCQTNLTLITINVYFHE